MKRILAIFLALMLIIALALPASAATTMKWDLGKAQQSINKTATELVQEVETKYPTWNDYFNQVMSRYWFFR